MDSPPLRLTSYASGGGCACKIPPGELEAALTGLTGQRPCLFRPPGGVVKGIAAQTRSRGMAITLWSVDSEDWRFEKHEDTAAAVPKIIKAATAGLTQKHPIVLLHDGGGDRSATVAALPQIISAYRAAGYRFTSVPDRWPRNPRSGGRR